MTLRAWLAEQDPASIPYRPGAPHTQGFGLRISDIGSPAHMGDDRGSRPPEIVMPFRYGLAEWNPLPPWRAWGSFLRIVPSDAPFGVELHVGHTTATEMYASDWTGHYSQGETLPCRAANIGVGTGAHTHTEMVVEYSDERRDELREASSLIIVCAGEVDKPVVRAHCERLGLHAGDTIRRFETQVRTWGIEEMSDRYAVRRGNPTTFPKYRVPGWGRGPVLLVDPYWALEI